MPLSIDIINLKIESLIWIRTDKTWSNVYQILCNIHLKRCIVPWVPWVAKKLRVISSQLTPRFTKNFRTCELVNLVTCYLKLAIFELWIVNFSHELLKIWKLRVVKQGNKKSENVHMRISCVFYNGGR